MEIKCGTDIIEIDRIRKSIEELEDNFLNRVYTKNEIKYCESKGKQKYQHYAARFAVKEATYKAISEQLSDKYDITWTDIETKNDNNGRPSITIRGIDQKHIENIDISISHCKQYATANVVVLYK